MNQFDLEDAGGFDFSVLDRAKIEDLEIGEKMESESSHFIVVREKAGYWIWYVKENVKGKEFCKTLEKAFDFLEDN